MARANSKFSTQHYNAIAKDIRTELAIVMSEVTVWWDGETKNLKGTDALVKLALRFAMRFHKDNEEFEPLKFLDACSPNAELYPLSELWDDYGGNNG
jgi:hypothetical protein